VLLPDNAELRCLLDRAVECPAGGCATSCASTSTNEVRPHVTASDGAGDGPFLINSTSADAAEANLAKRVSELKLYSGRSVHLNRLRQIMETFALFSA
jgi:hypothetical protein